MNDVVGLHGEVAAAPLHLDIAPAPVGFHLHGPSRRLDTAGMRARLPAGPAATLDARVQAFFATRAKDAPGAERGLAQTTEATQLCAALKASQDPAAILR